jgi:hypothetical protein
MKGRWIILVLLVSAAVLLAWFLNRPGHMQQTPSASEPKEVPIPELKTNLLEYTYYPSSGEGMPLYLHDSFSERLFSKLPSDALKKYEGSFTLDELRNKDGQAPSLNLKSSWLQGNRRIPEASVRVGFDPATGSYNVRGGGITDPKSNVGISFEKDGDAGESRTFLNWKKEF